MTPVKNYGGTDKPSSTTSFGSTAVTSSKSSLSPPSPMVLQSLTNRYKSDSSKSLPSIIDVLCSPLTFCATLFNIRTAPSKPALKHVTPPQSSVQMSETRQSEKAKSMSSSYSEIFMLDEDLPGNESDERADLESTPAATGSSSHTEVAVQLPQGKKLTTTSIKSPSMPSISSSSTGILAPTTNSSTTSLAPPILSSTISDRRELSSLFDEPLLDLFKKCYPDGKMSLSIFENLNPNRMHVLIDLLAIPFMKDFIYKNPKKFALDFDGLTISELGRPDIQKAIGKGVLTFRHICEIDGRDTLGRYDLVYPVHPLHCVFIQALTTGIIRMDEILQMDWYQLKGCLRILSRGSK